MTQCRACGYVSIDGDDFALCTHCVNLHTRTLERMEDGDAVASFSEVCSVAAHGWPIEREAVWRVG